MIKKLNIFLTNDRLGIIEIPNSKFADKLKNRIGILESN